MISFVLEVSLATQTVLLGLVWARIWSHPFDSGFALGDDNILRCIPGRVFEELVKQS